MTKADFQYAYNYYLKELDALNNQIKIVEKQANYYLKKIKEMEHETA